MSPFRPASPGGLAIQPEIVIVRPRLLLSGSGGRLARDWFLQHQGLPG